MFTEYQVGATMNVMKKNLIVSLILCLTAGATASSSPCILIQESICKDFGSGFMKLPNSLYHNTDKEVYSELRQWQPLVATQCHNDLKIFLCSMYTPICLEKEHREHPELEIKPCRALCNAVRNRCEPLMNGRNYSWPGPFSCSNFVDDNLCVNLTRPVRQGKNCSVNRKYKLHEVQKVICKNEFAVKARLLEKKNSKDNSHLNIKLRISKTLRGNLTSNKKGIARVRVPLKHVKDCKIPLNGNYLIAGKAKGRKIVVKLVLKWRKKFQKKLGREGVQLNCKKFFKNRSKP